MWDEVMKRDTRLTLPATFIQVLGAFRNCPYQFSNFLSRDSTPDYCKAIF
jgi:hypothetical protein